MEQNPLFRTVLTPPKEMLSTFTASHAEMDSARLKMSALFDYEKTHHFNLEILDYGIMLKTLVLAMKHQRCIGTINSLIALISKKLSSGWAARYNLIVAGTIFGEVLTTEAPVETVACILFNNGKRNKVDYSGDEIKKSTRVIMCVREIYCLTQLLKSNVKSGIPIHVLIHDLYNYLDKFNILFKDLFQQKALANDVLKPYAQVRNAIAHSHYIYHGDTIKLVNWKPEGGGKYCFDKIIDDNLMQVGKELYLLACIVSQYMALYQLMFQVKEAQGIRVYS